MRTVRFLLFVAALSLTSIATARAAGWPSWCPLGSTGNHGGSSPFTTVADHGGGSPAVLTKMGSSTKRLMANTKNLLTFNKSNTKANTPTVGYSTQTQHKEPGFFYKLFHPEPPPPPQTVKEWMSLEQVHP